MDDKPSFMKWAISESGQFQADHRDDRNQDLALNNGVFFPFQFHTHTEVSAAHRLLEMNTKGILSVHV